MCISNNQAVRFLLWLKHAYHKYHLSHFLLLLSYLSFIIIFSTLFFVIETVNSNTFRQRWQRQVSSDRNKFIVKDLLPEIFNNTKLLLYIHDQKAQYLTSVITYRLQNYETHLKLRPPMPHLECTFLNSVLFVFSTITTIGYGYIYPVTQLGRAISIVCSLIGIPFTIVVVKDLAYLLAKLLNFPCDLLAKLWAAFRFCTLKPVDEYELDKKLHGEARREQQDYRLSNNERLLAIPVTVAIFALVGWTSLGCFIVHMYMPHLEASVAFYFIFNSLSTIGVGDIEPGENPVALLVLFLYILIGLSIVSLFINLVHTKFSQAYWLPGRMYLPLRTTETMTHRMATFDSYDEMVVNDCPMNHLITLGILQADDKCPLIGITKKECAYADMSTQTNLSEPPMLPPRTPTPGPVMIPYITTSHEDVNSLIVETYGSKPARLIASSRKS